MSTGAPRGAGASRIHAELRRQILELVLAPGADLDETALAAAFNVSRTPLREALNRLATEQLVVIAPNRGAAVAPLDLIGFPAFIEALALAQGAVNAFAARRRTSPEMAGIEAAAAGFEAALGVGGLVLTEANRAFHGTIAKAARNPRLARFYGGLLDEGARLARVSFSHDVAGRRAHLDRVATQHRAIAAAIADGDAPQAEQLGRDHAVLFQQRLLDWLATNEATTLQPSAAIEP